MRIKRTVFDWHFCPHARKTEIQQQQQKVATHPDCLGGGANARHHCCEWVSENWQRQCDTLFALLTHTRDECWVWRTHTCQLACTRTRQKELTQNSRTNKRNEFAATTTTTTRRRRDESSSWLSCVQSMRTSQSGRNSRTRLAVHFREKLRVCASYTCIPQMCLWVCVCVQMTNAFDFKTDS